MTLRLNRLTDKSGNIPYPPNSSHQLVDDGKVLKSFNIDEVEAAALAEITRLKSNKVVAATEKSAPTEG